MTKARNIANIASDGSALADGTINYTDVSGTPTLATVATSGSFNDLSNQPAAFDPNTLAAVAVSGAYADVTGTPAAALPLTGGTVTGNVTLNGALNGVTSVDATTVASLAAAGVGGGGTIDFVASGSIAAGKPVRLNANGTVSQIASGASFDVPDNTGLIDISALVANTDKMSTWVFDSANNKAAFVYTSGTNIYLRSGYFNGTSWTWGAAVQLGRDENGYSCAAVGVDSNGVFLVYYYHFEVGAVFTQNARAFTVNTSGTITIGTNVVLANLASGSWEGRSNNNVYWDNTNNLWLIQALKYSAGVYKLRMFVLTVSGTTITGVGGNQAESTWTYRGRHVQVDEVNKYLYMANALNAAHIYRFPYSTSGVSAYTEATTITGASASYLESAGMSKFQSVYFAVNTSNFMTYTPAWGGNATGITNLTYSGYNVTDSICAWKNFATSTAATQKPTRINLSTGATTTNPVLSDYFGADRTARTNIWFDNYIDNQFYYIAYANSTYYLATRFLSNNSTFIGVADETKTTGQTVKVTVFGGTNDNVSGLTVGRDYYVNGSGNLTDIAGQAVGRAITATKISVRN